MYTKLDLNSRFMKIRRKLLEGPGSVFRLNEHGKIASKDYGAAYDSPWVFIEPSRKKFCFIWNNIFRGYFSCIPTPCRFACWKVVIRPRNVKELVQLHQVLRSLALPSKCGQDRRDYTYGSWGGYVYADSLPEAQKYARMVRKAVSKLISPDVPVTIKRGCTEMEALKPAGEWDEELTQEEMLLERRLNDLFQFEEGDVVHSRWTIEDIKYRWIRHAVQIGDPTAKETAIKLSGDPDAWEKLVVKSASYPYENESKTE